MSARTLLGWMFVALALCAVALQNAAGQTVEGDPPSRVARLSDLSGNVWLYRPDSGEWVEATRNLPVTTGDTLATEAGARVELQVGSSTFRLDSGSELRVSALDDNRISLQLRAGALAVRIRNLAETGPFDVSTEQGRFLALTAGRYRFDRAAGSSFAAVDSGQLRFEYGASALTVSPGQRAEFWIDSNGAAQYGLGGAAYDAFTAWNNERDRAAERGPVATRHASPEMTGVEDLDRYGSWEQTPDYGAVWTPTTVSPDWVPYSAGRWAWVRPWGWTWVDDAPWGFAPFHYGRWVNLRNRWCWTPGVREPRPIYAPALVGWIAPQHGGVPAGAGVGPAVGWFPLAPREVYVPAYRGSPHYIRGINTPYVRRGENIDVFIHDPLAPREFENRRIPRAVTVVPATAFVEQRRSLAPVAAQFRDAPWARDFARGNGSAPVIIAAPVGAPPSLANQQREPRPMPPPPGFTERRATGPGRPGRDREALRPQPFQADVGGGATAEPQRPGGFGDARERERNRLDRNGPLPPNGNPPLNAGGAPATIAPMPAGTGPSTSPRVDPLPVRPSFDGGPRAGQPGAPDGRQPGTLPFVPAQQQAIPSPLAVPEVPRVRPLPVGRGGERRGDEGRIGEERSRLLPRGEAPTLPSPARQGPAADSGVSSLRRPGEPPVGSERGQERAPGFRPAEPVSQPLRPEAAPSRAEVVVRRPPELQAPAPMPPVIAPVQAPRPSPPPPPLAVPAPVQRPVDTVAPPRRVELPRAPPPAVEPQRPALPERRNAPDSTR